MAATAVPVALPATSAAPAQAADDWNPPANLVQPLGEVWNHVESAYPDLYGFRNYGWDQTMADKGSVNYCVRWDSDAPVSGSGRSTPPAPSARTTSISTCMKSGTPPGLLAAHEEPVRPLRRSHGR
ncbi:hypothetical protein [Streptomyces sp. NRRL S-646]|uniref:hypothetical protein n=1 Tax=Streptomyces sp. NRRL S-646 TaxID=1463917 RepID=UPI000B099168|nr:hypothetical protein [Streptomyces sp. NRRL S-646]